MYPNPNISVYPLWSMLGFLGSLPMWSKGPNKKAILSHLFKWRWVRLERDTYREIQWERLIWEGKIVIERERMRGKIIVIFAYPLDSVFKIATADFFHHWIGLIFGQQVLRVWYFKLSGWIGKKIYVERNKCFALSAIYFRVLSFCCYCTNWGFVLIDCS